MNRNTTIGLFLIVMGISLMAMVSRFRSDDGDNGFTKEELEILNEADSNMRVLTIENRRDLSVLRAQSVDFSTEALLSEEFKRLSELMIATVTHPSQDGVGIAGPQVGLNRRIVAVQRFDKDGYPFEIYPNISIVWKSDSLEFGPEGCLSVPDRREDVARSTEIIIEYTAAPGPYSPLSTHTKFEQPTICDSIAASHLVTVRDTISGFTAVIFQHEVDHLDGVLYTDRVSN